MLEELERRNYARTTIDSYIHTVEHFAQYFRRSPDQLGPDQIREYQVALFKKFKLAPNTVSRRLAALRFFYIQTLKKAWSVAETPYPKKVLHPADDSQPGGGCAPYQLGADTLPSHHSDDPVRHWPAAC